MMLKFKGHVGGRGVFKKGRQPLGTRLVSTLGAKNYVTAAVKIPSNIHLVSREGYWRFTDGTSYSSVLHKVSATLAVAIEDEVVKWTMDARKVDELNTLIRRVCSISKVFSEGGVRQIFKIYYDHFPVNYSTKLSNTSCHITVNNFLGYKSPLNLMVENVLKVQQLDSLTFALTFTDLDARGLSYKTFFEIKRLLKSKLSKVKFVDCIYPVSNKVI